MMYDEMLQEHTHTDDDEDLTVWQSSDWLTPTSERNSQPRWIEDSGQLMEKSEELLPTGR